MDGAERVAPGEVFVRLVLPGSPAEVIGTVYDPEGTPVPGAWVEVGDRDPQVIRRTDARGSFEVGSLQPGVKPVRVYGGGFAAWEGEVECLPSATASMSIQLQRGASLVGQVTDGEDRLEGVGIQIYGLRYPQRPWASTDSEGRYRIQDLPGGELSVGVYSDELGGVRNTLQFTLGQETRWATRLRRK